MRFSIRRSLAAVVFVCSGPLVASAGWVVDAQNIAVRPDGKRMDPEKSTMYIAKNKVRVEQPASITLVDYDQQNFTIVNPSSESFWAGEVDDYLSEMVQNRVEAMREKIGEKPAASYGMPEIDESKLPSIVIKRTGATKKIAGYDTVKYTVESNGQLFQEIWLAEGLRTADDIDPAKALEYERKLSNAKIGKSAESFNALHRSADYRKLLEKGYALETVVKHPAGGFERTVTAIRQAEVEPSKFEVPESYRRVRLNDLFPAPKNAASARIPGSTSR